MDTLLLGYALGSSTRQLGGLHSYATGEGIKELSIGGAREEQTQESAVADRVDNFREIALNFFVMAQASHGLRHSRELFPEALSKLLSTFQCSVGVTNRYIRCTSGALIRL